MRLGGVFAADPDRDRDGNRDHGLEACSKLSSVLWTPKLRLLPPRCFMSPHKGSDQWGQGQWGQKRVSWIWGTHLWGGGTPATWGP